MGCRSNVGDFWHPRFIAGDEICGFEGGIFVEGCHLPSLVRGFNFVVWKTHLAVERSQTAY